MIERLGIAAAAAVLLWTPIGVKAHDQNAEVIVTQVDPTPNRNRGCRLRHYENTATQSNCVRVGRAPRNGYYSPEEYEQFNRNNRVMLPAYTCTLYKVVDKYNRVYYKEICQ